MSTQSWPWLESGRDLLLEPDPGPTPFAVDQLLVDRAVAMIVGPPKVGKTWTVLELAVAIATGRQAFGTLEVEQGPVIVVLEESGRDALHRRLDALTRGRALPPDELKLFYFAANRRVKLDDDEWRLRLLDAGRALKPRAIFFDPLARLKSSDRDEDKQKEMAPLLEFLRELRDETQSLVTYVHHFGHAGTHGRGSSDLEAFWESKITVERGDDRVYTLRADHREAEAAEPFRFRLAFDHDTATVRCDPVEVEGPPQPDVAEEILAFLKKHPASPVDEIAAGVSKRRTTVSEILETDSRFVRVATPSGRSPNAKCWSVVEQPGPDDGTGSDGFAAANLTDNPSADPRTPVGGVVAGRVSVGARPEDSPPVSEAEVERLARRMRELKS